MLYFALTGKPPFVRATLQETMRAHLEAPPPVASVLDSRILRDVDRVIVRALLRDPHDRHATAAEMRAAIGAVQVAAAGTVARLDPSVREGAQLPVGATRVLGRTSIPQRVAADVAVTAVNARSAGPVGRRDAVASASPSDQPGPGRSARLGAWISGFLAVGAAATILAFAAAGVPAEPIPTPTEVPTAAPAAEPPAPEAPAPVITRVGVPELTMMSLTDARRALADEGLEAGALSVVDSVHPGDTVLWSSPAAGERIETGSRVDLVVASGSNAVPEVAGLARANAVALVQAAGFTVSVVARRVATAAGTASGTIVGVEPSAGTVLRLGATITLIEAEAPLPPPPPTSLPTPTPTPVPTPTPEPGGG